MLRYTIEISNVPEIKDYLKKGLWRIESIQRYVQRIISRVSHHISYKQVKCYFFIDYITTTLKTDKTEKVRSII